jgi:hypothetical protein
MPGRNQRIPSRTKAPHAVESPAGHVPQGMAHVFSDMANPVAHGGCGK